MLQLVTLEAAFYRPTKNGAGHILISVINLHGPKLVKHFGRDKRRLERN